MKTWYGSVLPEGLFGQDDLRALSGFNRTYSNYALKAGVVVNIIESDDKKNSSGLFTEYDVAVVEQNQDVGFSLLIYRNCIRTDNLGSKADYKETKLRNSKKRGKRGPQEAQEQDGAIVLIQCLDANQEKALIVGGLGHLKRTKKLTKADGHAMISEFNGLFVGIDKEGAYSIIFNGATDTEGVPLKKDVGGSFFKILSDGSVEISDNKGQNVKFDKTGQSVSLNSTKDLNIKIGKVLNFSSGDSATLAVGKDLAIAAQGAVNLKGKSMTADIGGQMELKSKGLKIMAGPQANIKASQITLEGITNVGGPGGTPAVLLTTMFQGVGNMGGPVISMAIGPFSSKVKISP